MRSPLLTAGSIRAPMLVLHGTRDRNVPFAQARDFSRQLTASPQSKFVPFENSGHALPPGDVMMAALRFLDPYMRPGRR